MRGNHMDAADVLGLLRRRVAAAGSQAAFCREVRERHGIPISTTYLSQVMSGDRALGPRVWRALNLRSIQLFEQLSDELPRRAPKQQEAA